MQKVGKNKDIKNKRNKGKKTPQHQLLLNKL